MVHAVLAMRREVPDGVRGSEADVCGYRARVPSPAGLLTQVCVLGFLTGSRNLTWATDAWFLLDRWPHVDWNEVEDMATRCGVEMPLAATLRYLGEQLRAPVPQHVLATLEKSAATTGRAQLDALLVAAWPAARARQRVTPGSVRIRSRVPLYRSMMMPAPSYLRATGQAAGLGGLLGCYVRRPVQALSRRVIGRRQADSL